jgi:PilZ domain-containing protein
MNSWSSSGREPQRRRSQRVIFSIPVTISGIGVNGAFNEETRTLVINSHGALITLEAKISAGQELKIKTQMHREEQKCRVVYIGPTVQGKTQFGIEFIAPAPDFWRITFPPDDWSPAPLDDANHPVKS